MSKKKGNPRKGLRMKGRYLAAKEREKKKGMTTRWECGRCGGPHPTKECQAAYTVSP